MKKILYILHRYPQMSETYIETEIRALQGRFDLHIISTGKPDLQYEWHHEYELLPDVKKIIRRVGEISPDIIHTHYLSMVPLVSRVATAVELPWTVRSHSFDVLGAKPKELASCQTAVNNDLCLGLLGFHPCIRLLGRKGYNQSKLVPCFPIIEYDWFLDQSANGEAIMNVGACIPKKNMESYVKFAATQPEQEFNLYALGYIKADIEKLNSKLGSPVTIIDPVQPKMMPAEYKKHRWLVYTGSKSLPTVGWPLAVAEAQASGVGVCMQRIRPDLNHYLGGAGHLFDDINEVASIITSPVPEEMREQGFEQAKKSDIHAHVNRLVGLWRKAYP